MGGKSRSDLETRASDVRAAKNHERIPTRFGKLRSDLETRASERASRCRMISALIRIGGSEPPSISADLRSVLEAGEPLGGEIPLRSGDSIQ